MNVTEEELAKLCEMRLLLREAFAKADAEGLYLGAGRDGRKANAREYQEGPIFARLRELVGAA